MAHGRPERESEGERGREMLGGGGGSQGSIDRLVESTVAARLPQYLSAFSATMGGLAMGAVIGYSSPAGPQLMNNATTECVQLSQGEYSWFSSSSNLGAAAGGILGGFGINSLGRRGTMLASTLPFAAGWVLIGAAQNFAMLMCGRLLTGMCTGIICIATPTYIAEFASPDIRGILGSGFQLMVTIGVLLVYILGAVIPSWRWLAGVCGIPVVVFLLLMLVAKESPTFLLAKGRVDRAIHSLQYFRGKHYNIEQELEIIRRSLEETKRNKASFTDLLKPYNLKPFFICLALFILTQSTGITPVLFNMATIFQASGASISDDLSTIIIAAVMVAATATASLVIDRAGRKILLIISSSIMTVSMAALGIYFALQESNSEWTTQHLSWLPLSSLIVFIASFSEGFGPMPWIMLGELFSPEIKEVAASSVVFLNWMMAFVITLIFAPLQNAMGLDGVYLLFAGMCAVALVYSLVVLPETKGKTLHEIAAYFGDPSAQAALDCFARRE